MAVYRDKNGIVTFYVRYTDIYGNKKSVKRQSKKWKTIKEGKEAEKEFLDSVSLTDIQLKNLANLYFENIKPRVRVSSYVNYLSRYEHHIEPFFQDIKVSEITKTKLVQWQQWIYDKGHRDNMLSKTQLVLRSIFKFGVQYELIPKNPFTIPYIKREEEPYVSTIWNKEQYDLFEKQIEDIYDKAFFRTLFYTGLRIGEITGVTIDDYKDGKLTINKQRLNNGTIAPVKSKNGNRVIRLPQAVCDILDEMISTYPLNQENRQDWLFCGMKAQSRTNIMKRKNEYVKSANIPDITLHGFRHSHASMLIAMGFDFVNVAKRLGDSPTTIMKTYGHPYDEVEEKIITSLNNL